MTRNKGEFGGTQDITGDMRRLNEAAKEDLNLPMINPDKSGEKLMAAAIVESKKTGLPIAQVEYTSLRGCEPKTKIKMLFGYYECEAMVINCTEFSVEKKSGKTEKRFKVKVDDVTVIVDRTPQVKK